jgi:hypothetical protein
MPEPKAGKARHATAADTSAAVDELMRGLDHPCKAEIEMLRRAVLAVDPSIAEGVKWNAPSFRTTEYFATTNLRAKAGVGLILHLGAKVRDLPPGGLAIADPAGLLKWLARDRASIEFRTRQEVVERIPALQQVLRDWIRHV